MRPWVGHASSQGSVLLDLASYRGWQGQDPGRDLDRAIATFGEALRLNPNSYQAQEGSAEALLQRAEAALAGGRPPGRDLDLALEHLGRALLLNPGLATARWRQAQGLALRALVNTSAEDLRSALKATRPDHSEDEERLWARAQALWALARAGGSALQPGALEALRAAAAKSPRDGRIPFLEARLLLLMNRPSEARRALARAGDLNGNLRRAAAALSPR